MRPSRTVTVSLPPELAKAVDRAARAEGRNRSEMFREALRQYLARADRWEKIFTYGEQVARASGVAEGDVAGIVKASRRAKRGSGRRR